MQQIRMGIVGVGNMGSAHVKRFLSGECPQIQLTAVADIDPTRLAWAKEQLPTVKTFDSADALFQSGEVDAVLIATPHYFHPPMCRAALEAGLRVYVLYKSFLR